EALLPIFGMEPLLQGRSEIAFDLKDKDGAFALRNVKVELQPAPGVEIAVDGHIKDALALTGLDLAVRLQADDAASLSRLAGTEIPSISPVKARGRIVGTAAEPAIADLTLTAGSVERIMLTVTGSIAEPLKADGLVLKLRLQGPDSGALSSYASLDVPALGRFDLAGRLRGSASSARLSRIAGQFRHHNGMTIDLQGSIGDLQKAEKLDLGFGASIPGGNALGDLLALEMPLSDRLRAKGRVSGSAETMRLVDLDITMGGSDLAGEVAIDLRGDRPAVTGDLHSKRLDLSFLSNQEEPANQTKPVADSDASQRLIPDLAVDPGFAAMLDGGLKYRAARLNWDDLALSGVNVTVDSKGGVLTLNPSTAELAAGQLIVDGRMDQEGVNLTFDLRRAAMKTLGPMLDMTAVEGSLDLRGDLRAQGRDLRALAGSLNGTASVVVGQGYLHNSYLEPLVKDLVVALVEGDLSKQGARLHCFANGYEFKNGVAVSQVLLLDTDSVTVVGEGQVDLSSEAIKYHLNPRPKNPSLLSLATPVDVSGTLAQPTILPDSVAVAGGVATAVVGNLLLPGVGLLLPLLSAGTGEDNPCLKVVKNGKAKAAEKTTQPGALGQLGDAVSEGAGALLKLPGKLLPGNLLGSE
ncbi:MAG: AsmA family protein, partial [Rhodospirillaceae bacterium]|nr:AsmA family protein [Rhodospirillaceae bacterium]